MSAARIRTCRFSALDHVSRKVWGDRVLLLRALAEVGRFSAFEVPLTGKGGDNITYILNESGWIARTWGEYPWTHVELSPEGLKLLEHAQ